MKTILAAAALALAAPPADAHCYSVWNYPTPQRCGSKFIAHRASEAKTWFVQITGVPPDAAPAAPADPRTPEEIQDQRDHDLAVQTHKTEVNELMLILKADEASKSAATNESPNP